MPLPPPYDPTDKKCYTTVVKRWPVIITQLIDGVYKANHDLEVAIDIERPDPILVAKIAEGKGIIEKASKLKHDMGRDRPLLPIPDDGGSHVSLYNGKLEKLAQDGRNTWFTAPWLYAECYLYRLMRSLFALTDHWTQFDPFFGLKEQTFKGSGAAVYQLALTMAEIDAEAEKSSLETDLNRLEVLFDEMIQMCFWGNATDLSLLTTLSSGDIEKLQSVGKDAQAESRKYILRDDIDKAWEWLKGLKGQRLDIVLDNSGFEYFTDLILSDFLVTHTPFISKVVFHPKQIPWFVSDVTPSDARAMLAALASVPSTLSNEHTGYFSTAPPSQAHLDALHKLRYRWLKYFEDGKFSLNGSPGLDGGFSGGRSDPSAVEAEPSGAEFWTRPDWYRELAEYPNLAGLQGSGLVIFKGDLNYRKLTGDLRWPTSTAFETAIGPLAGKIPILSLRTNKADVVVGLPDGVGEAMDADPAKDGWRVNGRYGLISYLPLAT